VQRNYPTADTSGVWPFACDKLIPCLDVPHQTCGCKNPMDSEDFAIVYNMKMGTIRFMLIYKIITRLSYG
jgi:hypothetical protein